MDGGPAACSDEVLAEPRMVVMEVILAVDAARDWSAATSSSDNEAKHGEDEKGGNQQDHEAEVEPESPGYVEAGSNEAG